MDESLWADYDDVGDHRFGSVNAGRPNSCTRHFVARLARRLLIARSEGTSRFAGPSFGAGRQASRQPASSVGTVVPHGSEQALRTLEPGPGPPNRTVKRTSLTPGPGARDLPWGPSENRAGSAFGADCWVTVLVLTASRVPPGPPSGSPLTLALGGPRCIVLRDGFHRPDFAAFSRAAVVELAVGSRL